MYGFKIHRLPLDGTPIIQKLYSWCCRVFHSISPTYSTASGLFPTFLRRTLTPQAFSLIEIMAVIAIVAILAGSILPLTFQKLTGKRGKITENKLEEFKKAVIGNPFVIDSEVRTSFGYLGDMGNLPTNLLNLYEKGTQPNYTYDAVLKTGAGWRGPYLDPAILEDLSTLKLDGYRQELAYSTTAFTDTETGASVVGKLTSVGVDRSEGTGDDWHMYIFHPEAFSTVSGFLEDAVGNRLPGIKVTMNYPTNGSLATPPFTTTDSTGYFSFSNVPFGNRSISVEPKLIVAPGSTRAGDSASVQGRNINYTGDNDGIHDDIVLYVTNLFPNDITIQAIKVYYDIGGNPPANFSTIVLAGKEGEPPTGGGRSASEMPNAVIKFDTPNTRVTISGSGTPLGKSYLIRVQSPQINIPDLKTNTFPAGSTVRMEILDFNRSNKPINISGIPFKVEFYDTWQGQSGTLNSTIFFTPNVF